MQIKYRKHLGYFHKLYFFLGLRRTK